MDIHVWGRRIHPLSWLTWLTCVPCLMKLHPIDKSLSWPQSMMQRQIDGYTQFLSLATYTPNITTHQMSILHVSQTISKIRELSICKNVNTTVFEEHMSPAVFLIVKFYNHLNPDIGKRVFTSPVWPQLINYRAL